MRDRGHLRIGRADIDIGLKEDFDDTDAVVRVGDDVFDVINGRRQRPLERRDDASGHLVRRQPGILPDHTDHRDANVGKNVGGRPQRGERSDDQQKQRQYDKRIRPAQRDADQGNHAAGNPLSAEAAGTDGTKAIGRADLPDALQIANGA